MIDVVCWTAEDAAVAADTAMDRGAFAAELWRYLSPELVQQLVGCAEHFVGYALDNTEPRTQAHVDSMFCTVALAGDATHMHMSRFSCVQARTITVDKHYRLSVHAGRRRVVDGAYVHIGQFMV